MKRLQVAALALAVLGAGAAVADPVQEAGRKIFTEGTDPPCTLCHTLRAAGATGKVGPSLDDLKPDKARVLEAVRSGLGVMPAFDEQLSEAQIEEVADFVVAATSGR